MQIENIFPNCYWSCKQSQGNRRKNPKSPCKRWGHTAVAHDKYMFLFGGHGTCTDNK